MADTKTKNPAATTDIKETLKQVMKKGSNKELALIADNPDGSAEILICRGDAGEAETYWFHVSSEILAPALKSVVAPTLKLDDEALATEDGIYRYMATVAGVAACFQVGVPGTTLRLASFGPFESALYQFVAATRGWTRHETVFIKRNRNLAYRYRKLVDPRPPRDKAPKSAGEADDFDGEEIPSSAYDVSHDELERLFGDESAQ